MDMVVVQFPVSPYKSTLLINMSVYGSSGVFLSFGWVVRSSVSHLQIDCHLFLSVRNSKQYGGRKVIRTLEMSASRPNQTNLVRHVPYHVDPNVGRRRPHVYGG